MHVTQEGQMHASVSIRRSQYSFSTPSLLFLLLILPATLLAQAYFGTVSGELTDATGAVVQGATVMFTDQEKGFNFNTTSDSSGRYLFRSIPPGRTRSSSKRRASTRSPAPGSRSTSTRMRPQT